MRPLIHPALDDISLESIFHALSDPARLDIFMELVRAECPKTCSSLACTGDKTLPKSTLSQHFRILREAGLIRSVRVGVTMENKIRAEELNKKFGSLLETIVEAYVSTHKPKPRAKKRR